MKIYVETAAFSFCIIQNITMTQKSKIKYKKISVQFWHCKDNHKRIKLIFDELF